MSHARKKNPQVDHGPDYVLLLPTSGYYYVGIWDEHNCHTSQSMDKALRLRGAGLASAERALMRRGYVVERVRV